MVATLVAANVLSPEVTDAPRVLQPREELRHCAEEARMTHVERRSGSKRMVRMKDTRPTSES